jgi:hypothetical protein
LQLRFVLPDPLIPGQPFRGAVVVSPYWSTPIGGIRVELRSSDDRVVRRFVSGPGKLVAARHLFPFELDAPADLPEKSIARVWTIVDAKSWSYPSKGSWGVRVSPAERELDPDAIEAGARYEAAWAEAADRFSLERPAPWVLTGQASAVKFRIQLEERGKLVARIRYPSLGLGLSLTSGYDPEGEGMWIDLMRLRGWAWDRVQAHTFIGRIFHELLEVNLERMTDTYTVANLLLRGPDVVPSFARSVCVIASAIKNAREMLPPPTTMAKLVDPWRALASELEGALDLPRMAITGRFSGGEILIEPSLLESGRHTATRIVFRPSRPIEPSMVIDSLDGDTAAIVEPAVTALRGDALYVSVRRGEIAVDIPPIQDPGVMKSVLRKTAALASQLADVAPYR